MKVKSFIITAALVAFCMMAGAAGYKQVYLTQDKEPVEDTTEETEETTEVLPVRSDKIVVYNISANAAVFYEAPSYPELIPEDDDIQLLAACVEAEAGNQSLYGKRLVADVILNRVDSDIFPNTIHGVITQPHQFSTYWNGAMDKAEVTDETYQAVYMELNQISYPGVVFFDCGGFLPYGTPWKQIGDHYFSTL